MNRSLNPARRALLACVVAASCGSAMAQTFTADEGSVPGSSPNLVVADRISFQYDARVVQDLLGGTYDGDDPFSASGYLTKASFAIGGSSVTSQLNGFGPTGYRIYGLFDITGTSTANAGGIDSTFSTLTMTLYMDPGADTGLGFSGNLATTTGGTGDDYALVNYTLQQGEANIEPGLANGDFDTLLVLALTPLGEAYFSQPRPFYLLENFGGNIETLAGASLTAPFVASLQGGGLELFVAVPEPASLALIAAGLCAVGFAGRGGRRDRPSDPA